MEFKIGDKIQVKKIAGEGDSQAKEMEGSVGKIKHIDDLGQLHTTISGIALIPEQDTIEFISGVRNGYRIFKVKDSEEKDMYILFKKSINMANGASGINCYECDEHGVIIDLFDNLIPNIGREDMPINNNIPPQIIEAILDEYGL